MSGSGMYGVGPAHGNTRRDNSINTGRTDNSNGQNNDQNNQRRDNNDPGNDDTNNNDGIDDKVIQDIWKDAEDTTNKQNNNNNNNNNNSPPTTDTRTPDEKIKAHLKEVGLETITLTEEDKEKAKNGDFSGITAAMTAFGQQSYIKAMSSANTMIQAAVENAVKKAVGESKSSFEGTRLLEKMNEALPATKDPAIGPMAATVLQRLVNKGLSNEKAIEGVRQYFLRTMKAFDPDYVEPNSNLRGDFRNTPRKSSDRETDWVDLIRG